MGASHQLEHDLNDLSPIPKPDFMEDEHGTEDLSDRAATILKALKGSAIGITGALGTEPLCRSLRKPTLRKETEKEEPVLPILPQKDKDNSNSEGGMCHV